jgi:hypothetical protein
MANFWAEVTVSSLPPVYPVLGILSISAPAISAFMLRVVQRPLRIKNERFAQLPDVLSGGPSRMMLVLSSSSWFFPVYHADD